MERLARLVEWNDARGYGFVELVEPGAGLPHRLFLHIADYRLMGRRPEAGELLHVIPVRQSDGRWRASRAVRAASRAHRRVRADAAQARHLASPTTWLPPLLVAAFAALAGWAAWRQRLPAPLAWALAAVNLLAFLAYWQDKRAAQAGARRTPETTLHALELLGGWPAAWLAQQCFRHKTRKPAFRWTFLLASLLNLAVLAAFILGRGR